MENEIQKNEDTTPNQMIQLAIENKADLGQVRELLELKKLYEADEARRKASDAYWRGVQKVIDDRDSDSEDYWSEYDKAQAEYDRLSQIPSALNFGFI